MYKKLYIRSFVLIIFLIIASYALYMHDENKENKKRHNTFHDIRANGTIYRIVGDEIYEMI